MTLLEVFKRGGDRCPKCGSEDISGHSCYVSVKDCSQEMSCNSCECHWNDFYALAGTHSLQDNDVESVTSKIIDLRGILLNILNKKEVLPLLLGIHEDLDQLIEETLKNEEHSS